MRKCFLVLFVIFLTACGSNKYAGMTQKEALIDARIAASQQGIGSNVTITDVAKANSILSGNDAWLVTFQYNNARGEPINYFACFYLWESRTTGKPIYETLPNC